MKLVEKTNALRSELSWTHYRSLMRVEDEAAREFYLDDAVKCGWSSRQLDRQIISEHISNILSSGELDETSIGISDKSSGGRRPKIYNLDMAYD